MSYRPWRIYLNSGVYYKFKNEPKKIRGGYMDQWGCKYICKGIELGYSARRVR